MKKKEGTQNKEVQLTDAEVHFCELYIYGGCEFAGQMTKCYTEAFGVDKKNIPLAARRMLAKPPVMAKVKELTEQLNSDIETQAVKLQISETLRAVMEETSKAQYYDKDGNDLSPAPLRAVSVNAAKALMDLYPIKHIHESKLRIEGGDGNVVFNVIVPEIHQQ